LGMGQGSKKKPMTKKERKGKGAKKNVEAAHEFINSRVDLNPHQMEISPTQLSTFLT
jgi:hypothetical protein